MQPYHLVKLVEWASPLRSRKRLQKVVYLLQASGCSDLDASYILHHYGPYSSEVASVSDQLVRSGILEETAEAIPVGMQYSYQLSEAGRQAVQQLEHGPQANRLESFRAQETKARSLLNKGMGELELGSTMVYFYRQTEDWDKAVKKACEFKKLPTDTPECQAALRLAKETVQQSHMSNEPIKAEAGNGVEACEDHPGSTL
jgi:uncharacterized protein YwgA